MKLSKKIMIAVALFIAVIVFAPKLLIALPVFGLLNRDETKVNSGDVDVFLAIETDAVDPVTPLSLAESRSGGSATWFCAGSLEEENPDTQSTPQSINNQSSCPIQVGSENKHTMNVLQTDYAHLVALEGFIRKPISMILVKKGTDIGYRYQHLGMLVGWKGNWTFKKPNMIPVTIQNMTGKLTDCYDEITLTNGD